jgi:transcriptional regulator with XRE-family HTH domain
MSFGNNVRYYRVKKGLTLQKVSQRLGVSINYLSKLEQDKAKLKPDFLPRLCSVLNIHMETLFEENKSNVFK